MVRENTSLPKIESIRSGVAPSGSSTRVGMDTRVGVVTERCASLAGGGRGKTEHNHPARAGDTRAHFPMTVDMRTMIRLNYRPEHWSPRGEGRERVTGPAQPVQLTN